MVNTNRFGTLLALGLALGGCGDSGQQGGDMPVHPISTPHGTDSVNFNAAGTGLQYSPGAGPLADPQVDYALALRTASLKLRGNLPGLDEQQGLQSALKSGNPDDAQLYYESLVRKMIYNSTATFDAQMFHS